MLARTAVGRMAIKACMPARFGSSRTADLCDKLKMDSYKCGAEKAVKIMDPALNFRDFGGLKNFSGQVTTIKAYESNPMVRKVLEEEPGNGRVLVVDGGGSMRCGMFGDKIAKKGADNGWKGVIIYGCVRDSVGLSQLPLGVKALNTHPVGSHQDDQGVRDVPVVFGGVRIQPGQYIYADEDGIIVSDSALEGWNDAADWCGSC